MGYNPQESLENTISTMGTLLGVHPIVPRDYDSCTKRCKITYTPRVLDREWPSESDFLMFEAQRSRSRIENFYITDKIERWDPVGMKSPICVKKSEKTNSQHIPGTYPAKPSGRLRPTCLWREQSLIFCGLLGWSNWGMFQGSGMEFS